MAPKRRFKTKWDKRPIKKVGTVVWDKLYGRYYEVVLNKQGKKVWKKKPVSKTSKKRQEKESIWGKNIKLEKFWRRLASGEYMIAVYTNNTHKYVKIPIKSSIKSKKTILSLKDNPKIKALLTTPASSDGYEYILYPKAKLKTPTQVIKNYKKYFKSRTTGNKEMFIF